MEEFKKEIEMIKDISIRSNEHLLNYPARQKEMLENFENIRREMKGINGKIDQMKLLNDEWIMKDSKNHERVNRVLFGDPLDPKDDGIHGKIDVMYGKVIGKEGFWAEVFFIAKVAGATTAIGVLLAALWALLKK